MPSFAEPPFQRYEKLNDGTIISGEHVIRSIQEFESKIKVIKTEHGDAVVYAVTSNDQNAETYKIVIGTVEIDVAVDENEFMTVIEVYLRLPTCCKVQIAKGFGNLREVVRSRHFEPHRPEFSPRAVLIRGEETPEGWTRTQSGIGST